jgi:hypothetical protein
MCDYDYVDEIDILNDGTGSALHKTVSVSTITINGKNIKKHSKIFKNIQNTYI